MQCRDKWERGEIEGGNEEGAEKRRKENCSAGPHFSVIFENVWICSGPFMLSCNLQLVRNSMGNEESIRNDAIALSSFPILFQASCIATKSERHL